ncbi:MAG: hypothetical protein IV107_24075 [Paucibacter sp.]|nr:hypothetical protein [Roseateles sp.]
MSEDAIALALGITRPTLAKHFMVELTAGAAVKKMEALDALFAQVKKGNVTAIKAVLLLGDAIDPRPKAGAGAGAGEQAASVPASAGRLGKKEAQQVAAVSAADGTDWAGILPNGGRVQ